MTAKELADEQWTARDILHVLQAAKPETVQGILLLVAERLRRYGEEVAFHAIVDYVTTNQLRQAVWEEENGQTQ